MTKQYYAILGRRDKLKAITNSHQELVEIMTVFGEKCEYMPVSKDCAKRLAQEETSRLKRCLEVN